ncbi:hypothetical protein TL16_g02207 [Triparma laevis f. inornata]|uniref:Alpha N-terminal protein methyltransferase 1 n=2 Tax=Triparma laevis TaxID=1534972 RepID=A0A9W6ZC74_9STRA|nr:hypothetical protein TrLO_g4543 [Triparma laevis f. longispina]GMH56742.1 hypothetical protein TL16_g02207 [Triparma laevis f. inornata]
MSGLATPDLAHIIDTHLHSKNLPTSGNLSNTEEPVPTVTALHEFQHQKGTKWYSDATAYWEETENCPATVDGVLGGFAHLSPPDVKGSLPFIDVLQSTHNIGNSKACDIGAGIGRVSKLVLLERFSGVDLVEVSSRLIKAAPEYIGDARAKDCRFMCLGMEDFDFGTAKYDVVWVQWVIGHLTDEDLITFLNRAAVGLKPNGVIVVKDNVSDAEAFWVDEDDSSVTRGREYMTKLFDLAGMEIIMQQESHEFPKEIFPVPMYALRKR